VEVEVEDEVLAKLCGAYVGYLVEDKEAISIQNQFRMDGFHNLKICSQGYLKILLWSDKVGEVKEVVGSVRWWCSLFERIVPWSSLLVSDQRVTWLRCFGVPIHAWGFDLFRDLAFKFGRFIDVDQMTINMVRCDVARIRILTGERKLIDSSMAVNVLGQRFDIRVVEENGGWVEGGCGGKARDGVEDVSSRASSDGGISVAAAVVGFSESSSEADVSDSCHVLMDVENRREGRKEVVVGFCRKEDEAIVVSSSSSHFLGNHGLLVGTKVNCESDKREGYHVLGSGGAENDQGVTSVKSTSESDDIGVKEDVGVDVYGSSQKLGDPSDVGSRPTHLADGRVVCDSNGGVCKGGGW
jgi:hypothetical protein